MELRKKTEISGKRLRVREQRKPGGPVLPGVHNLLWELLKIKISNIVFHQLI
jgi:hypothetical protein